MRSEFRPLANRIVCAAVAAVGIVACAGEAPPAPPSIVHANPTRGYIVVSIDTLRADRLGFHGYERDTSPFLDRLASRATVFERAIVQLPGTLPSHMSIFTGLYPAEHGVYPPDGTLSTEIVTLPMRFRDAGYTTAGFTEGGYAAGMFGFDRGFDEFSDVASHTRHAFESTLDKARSFLAGLGPSEPYFLFIHTYAVHDPYDPPEPYRAMFWDEAVPNVFEPTGENLAAVNRDELELSASGLRYFNALYDAGIRYADDQLAGFWRDVEALGLADETTLLVTSDHGEEFLEHGRLAHEQVYPETLHVPLLVAHPAVAESRRVASLVESIDIAPTLYELAGFGDQPPMSGSSLAGFLFGAPEPEQSDAYAEAFVSPTKTLFWRERDTYQVVRAELLSEAGGYWAMPSITFDWRGSELDLRLRGFRSPRRISVSANGQPVGTFDIASTPTPLHVPLPGDTTHDVTIRGNDCDSPASLGINDDTRCMSFFVYADDLTSTQLYALDLDPWSAEDVGAEHPALQDLLVEALRSRRFELRGSPGAVTLDQETVNRLRALGYLQ